MKTDLKKKFAAFCDNNILVFVWIVLAIVIELSSLCFIGDNPWLTKPLYPLLLLATIILLLFAITNIHVKYAICLFLLVCQTALTVGLIFLYDSNGTFFEWSMINQRNDARGTIEDLSLRGGLLALCCVLFALYIVTIILVCLLHYRKHKEKYRPKWQTKLITSLMSVICAVFLVLTPAISGIKASKLSYVDRILYSSSDNKYQQVGISANALYEFFNGTIADAMIKHSEKGVAEQLDNNGSPALENSEFFGVSKGNNLIYILVESFEWYAFLENCTPEQSAVLYPNINKFFGNSVYANKFYSREKTDTAEMLALIGSNPSDKYVNYDFPNNEYPYSLPNLFRESVEQSGNTVKQIKSFHANTGSFYNRDILHKNLGFEKLVSIEDMEKEGVENLWSAEGSIHERNLDSQTIEVMQDEMFPNVADNEQYMTFWITFTMHGYYVERESFKREGYYDKLDEVGAYPDKGDKQSKYIRTYAAAVMDFDKALGIMMDKLEREGQLDRTTIVMFADHNTYYNSLSSYAKGIDERYDSELYRVPFLIYDQKLKAAYEQATGSDVIEKFTTTADMLPTILDIFGIHGYKNLYLGSSMFLPDVESVIYSRAYRIFVTDKLITYSAKQLLYTCDGFTKADYDDFILRAKEHLNKLEFIDKIFHNNYFKSHEYVPLL